MTSGWTAEQIDRWVSLSTLALLMAVVFVLIATEHGPLVGLKAVLAIGGIGASVILGKSLARPDGLLTADGRWSVRALAIVGLAAAVLVLCLVWLPPLPGAMALVMTAAVYATTPRTRGRRPLRGRK